MALFRSERGIGRGEAPESQLEAPFLVGAMLLFGLALFVQHQIFHNTNATVALALSGAVFGITMMRVAFGVYILMIAMLLSPEIEMGDVASGERAFTIRYDDLLIMVIFFGVMLKLAYDGRFSLWQPSPINIAILLYFGLCIVSTLLALDRNLGAWDRRSAFFVMMKMLQYYMVFWLVGQAVTTRIQVRRQLAVYFIVAAIVSVYGIYSIGTTPRVSAPFETGGTEPNTLGGYLVVAMCVALALSTQAPTFARRYFFLGLFALFRLSHALHPIARLLPGHYHGGVGHRGDGPQVPAARRAHRGARRLAAHHAAGRDRPRGLHLSTRARAGSHWRRHGRQVHRRAFPHLGEGPLHPHPGADLHAVRRRRLLGERARQSVRARYSGDRASRTHSHLSFCSGGF
jgi:hypothetical protein